jgi:hypothetical protein
LLGTGILVNYFDRFGLSVAGPQLQQEFGLDPAQLGLIFSVFFRSYAVLQIPVGVVLYRFAVMPIGRIGAALWPVAPALTALAGGPAASPSRGFSSALPRGRRSRPMPRPPAIGFPRDERGLGSAAKFSNVIGAPLIGFAVVNFGGAVHSGRWRSSPSPISPCSSCSIAIRAPIGAWATACDFVRKGGAATEGAATTGAGAMVGYLLRTRKIWG